MQDAWRAYLELALGLTEATRRRAERAVQDLVGRGGATAVQLQSLTGELVSASRANREALAKLVHYEVDRAMGAMGLATSDEVAELTARVRQLEREVSEASARAAAAEAAADAPVAAPVRQAPGAEPATGQTATEEPEAATPTAGAQAPRKVSIKKASATGATAKKATGAKTEVKKTEVKKSPGKKTSATRWRRR